jgi:thiamine kinase-like enzyme
MDWLDFPESGFAGLLQRQVDGRTANFCDNPFLVEQLIELVSRLHKDAEIRSNLNTSGSEKTCLDHFVETYIDRFNADLQEIAAVQPSFVSASLLKWMRNETERLLAKADSAPAFHNPAGDPVHGDLNEGNVLVTPNYWFIVDWDDLALGDPAVEFAYCFGPWFIKVVNGLSSPSRIWMTVFGNVLRCAWCAPLKLSRCARLLFVR